MLGHELFLDAGWNGLVDFYIKDVKWAIERLRDGSDLNEHIQRFLPGGKYHRWIKSGEIQDYILLDYRTSRPSKRDDAPFLYSVVFSKDYTSYEIYDAKGDDPVVERVALLSNND